MSKNNPGEVNLDVSWLFEQKWLKHSLKNHSMSCQRTAFFVTIWKQSHHKLISKNQERSNPSALQHESERIFGKKTTRWGPEPIVINGVVMALINGRKQMVNWRYNPYKWSYFTLLTTGFWAHFVGNYTLQKKPPTIDTPCPCPHEKAHRCLLLSGQPGAL